MKYYIIAGEASGDLHGSNLIKALHAKDPQATIQCWGGEAMEAAGATLRKHYKDLAFMGFVEVLFHLKTILRNLSFCKEDILQFQPDVLVLIDYPGFNMRIATWAKQQGIKVVYYISPQVWAWKEKRVHSLKASVDKLLVILPFEVAYFKQWNFEVDYVGHPLIEVITEAKQKGKGTAIATKPIIALLPGSRKQEIAAKLPIMLSLVPLFPEYQFVIAQAPSMDADFYKTWMPAEGVLLVPNRTYEIVQQAAAAIVTSGTATLETALFGVPQLVCYKGNPISFWLAKRFVKIKFIALANLIMNRSIVPELIQDDLNTKNLHVHLQKLLMDEHTQQQLQADYAELWTALGSKNASDAAANAVLRMAQQAH
jgi:lipid-A-disaccharide synthase